jgi:hypothetical protein
MNTHLVGDRFIMVSIDTWRRVAQAEGDLGTSKLYKGVTVGMTLAQAQTRAFTNYGKGLVPYAPCFVTGARDGGNNLTISWYRRSRYNAEWRDASEIPIGEDTEAYEVDILDSVGNVLRVLSSTTTSVVYSAADQTTDFGSPASLISIIVYQMSAIIGRGYGTRIAV